MAPGNGVTTSDAGGPLDLERLNRGVAGRYRLERELGSGGMATVYLAEDLRHHRHVALKVLRPELAAALGPDRFLREIEVVAGLNHPHILPLHDSGQVEGTPYYVMPVAAGESLRDRLEREGPLPVDESLRIAEDLAGALDYAHRQGVVHRDIKPENVLLHEGEVLLADFGIALALSQAGGERLTGTGFAPGTPQYMSPEQASGDVTPDARSDVYALGAVLYEMLAGEPPYTGLTAQAVIVKVLADPVPSVRRLRATVPETVDEVVTRALAKAPTDRYETAGRLVEALKASGAPDAGEPRASMRGRARRRIALGAGAAVAGVAAVAVLSRAPPPTPLAPETGRLAVLPWTVSGGDPELSYLSEGLVHLLSASLDGVGDLRMVDPHALLSFVDRECAGAADPGCGRRLAGRFGAERFVLGTVVPLGPDRFELIATVYASDGAPLPRVRESADRWSPEAAIDAIGRHLVAAEAEGAESELLDVAALTSPSLSALKAYLEGERAFRGLDIPRALDAFSRALAADSTFALAHFRLSEAAEWAALFDLSRDHTARAMRHRERLPVRARRLLEAFDLWLRGEGTAARAAYRSILRTWPDDVTAWYWFAESLLHWNAFEARSATEAAEPLERVLAYEPDHVGALFHLVDTRARAGHLADLDSLADRFLELSQGGGLFDFYVEAIRALALPGEGRLEEAAEAATRLSDDALIGGAMNAPVYTQNLAGARLLLAEMVAPTRPPAVRAAGHAVLAHLDVAEGRWTAARERLRRAEALRPGWGLQHEAFLASLPGIPLADAEAERLRAALAGAPAALPPAGPFEPSEMFARIFLEPHVGSYAPVYLYLEGLLAARRGDVAGVRSAAAGLDTTSLPPRAGSLAPDAARTLRALAFEIEGDDARALEEMQAAELRVTYPLMLISGFHSRGRHRYLRAELLARLGRDEEALAWYATLAELSPYDLVYLAPAALRQGEIHERLGDSERAAELYHRFVELWRDADPELQPVVGDVRARIERLEADGR